MKTFKPKTVIQIVAVIAALYGVDQVKTMYQTKQVEESVDRLLGERQYESAIQVLREANQQRFNPKLAQRLARLLTTNPRLSARDYSQAIFLSNQVIQSTFSNEVKTAAIDTLACARFANREVSEARAIAEKNHLDQRAGQFAIGRPCQDSFTGSEMRSIASEKN